MNLKRSFKAWKTNPKISFNSCNSLSDS